MTNNAPKAKVKQLVKPTNTQLNLASAAEVTSLCEPFNISCGGTYNISCTKFSDVGKDDDILF
jgi:hypothetical protein